MQSYIGRRVRLMAPIVNSSSYCNVTPSAYWKPVEDLPVGLEGVVSFAQDSNDVMMVDWDDGSKLNLFINEDKWEFVESK